MSKRHFPVRPNLEQLKHQAKDLLRAIRRGDADALAELREHHPKAIEPEEARLADAQHALARAYGLASWPRLVTACRMTDAIWRGDLEAVRVLVTKDPRLLEENARGTAESNWGPPMSYAANVGQDAIIEMLHGLGAKDVQHAFDRACLQEKIETAKKLQAMGARPSAEAVMWSCETLSASGLEFALGLGAPFADRDGNEMAPVAMLLQTYSRHPAGKHACLEIASRRGIALPETAPMAVHRGRMDLLQEHLRRDAGLFRRTFSHEEIYPPEAGCDGDHSLALHGTPLEGGTLLHLCVDFDEIELALWMVEHGADVNARAAVDAEGFGGHTALFGCVVSQSYRCGRQTDGQFARMLLDYGADPNRLASLRKRLRFVEDQEMHEYRDVTPLAWGERFAGKEWVNREAMGLIAERGGRI